MYTCTPYMNVLNTISVYCIVTFAMSFRWLYFFGYVIKGGAGGEGRWEGAEGTLSVYKRCIYWTLSARGKNW